MKILITGICGFVGSRTAQALRELRPEWSVFGIDNFIRPGSETNPEKLRALGIKLFHGDMRMASDIDALPAADWVIDAAANPSVLAGIDGNSSSRQVVEHNLLGTVNVLEYCRRHAAGFVLLSTSRVYSIPYLAALPIEVVNGAFQLKAGAALPAGISTQGLDESFSVAPPVSLYGATKLASESLALEYGDTFNFPVCVNRCGVLAGAGQFGRPDQGILAYWINAWLHRQPLRYIGFRGTGAQIRDAFHPQDLAALLVLQIGCDPAERHRRPRLLNVGGGMANTFSLAGLSDWCHDRLGPHTVAADRTPRSFDIPWMVMNSALAERTWGWRPRFTLTKILEEIAEHASHNPDWLMRSAPLQG